MRERERANDEKHESRPRGEYGDFQVAELERLEDEIEEAERVLKEDPEDEQMPRYLELAEKKRELFLSEHDNTGSYKFKRFGREVGVMFEDNPDEGEAATLELKDGRIETKEGFEGKRLMFVNMGELDRFNKEGGGHAAGDAALRDAAVNVERIVQETIGESGASYELFRYSGTEFMLSVDGMDEETFAGLMREVNDAQAGIPGNEGVEKVPLIATGVELAGVIDMVNQLELEREDGKNIDSEQDAAREIVGVAKALADHQLEVEKFVRRAERVQEKLRSAGDDSDALKDVGTFYDNYMGKMFKGTGLETLDDLRPENLSADALREKAEAVAREKRGIEEARNSRRDEIIASVLKERKQSLLTMDTENFASDFAKERADASKLATIPEMTEGQMLVQRMKETAEKAGEEGSLERQLGMIDAQIEDAKRDRGTGLLERGEYYKQLEAKIAEAKKDGREVSAVFIDMGFLKYFDKKGGADVGDAALKKGAELMSEALKGVEGVEGSATEGEVFRYGGDEFTVIIDGGPAEVEKYKQVLEVLKERAGRIPTGKHGEADGYHPTELVFNYGNADIEMLDRVFETMKEAGAYTEEDLADEAQVANVKAELMTLIADKGVEHEKAAGRFEMLIRGLRDPAYGTDAARKEQIDNMVTFSAKAIFAEKNGKEMLEGWAASGLSMEELRPKIEKWVEARVEERVEKEKDHAELRDRVVEVHAKLTAAEQQVQELTAQIEAAAEENQELRDRLAAAERQRKMAEDEKRAIIEARGKLDSAPPQERAA